MRLFTNASNLSDVVIDDGRGRKRGTIRLSRFATRQQRYFELLAEAAFQERGAALRFELSAVLNDACVRREVRATRAGDSIASP